MYSRLRSSSVQGIAAFGVEIETHIENNLPAFIVVGLPDSAVKESRERVSAAIKNSGLPFPQKKITVNLAPADIRKEGSAFDLPIAIGILAALGMIDNERLSDTIILGELALDGSIRPIHGALSIAVEAAKNGIKTIMVPAENAGESALVNAVATIPVQTLSQAARYFTDEETIAQHTVDTDLLFSAADRYLVDMADVKGQENVKRAMEVAAAGGHNIIMVGPPGSGKTMIAKRLPTILPPLTLDEALETTKIHSVAGALPPGASLVTERPFRAPHHTISDAALVGGGMGVVRAGEISLAHHGVLFLDELPEFARNVLEVLRQPLEDKRIAVSRVKMRVEYPANFMLVCSMNPCPCGNFGNPYQSCACSPQQIQRYMSKISGPLLDRIDIHIEVSAVKYQELAEKRLGEPSHNMRDKVVAARKRQAKRFDGKTGVFKNADMSSRDIRTYCALDSAGQELVKTAMNRLNLSARAFDRILKVSRTIADLDGSDAIALQHIAEAIQYRSLDRQYWNG